MATTTGISSVLMGPLAPATADTVATTTTTEAAPSSSVKSMEQLLQEIDQIKTEVESAVKTLEKIDTGRRKAAANRDRSIEGRTQVKALTQRVVSLQQQMNEMKIDNNPNWTSKKLDKKRRTALKTLSGLSNKLNHVDKHLEKATGTTTAPTDSESVAASRTATEENTKKIAALVRRPLLNAENEASSRESPDPSKPPSAATRSNFVDRADDTGQESKKGGIASDTEEQEEEEEDEDEEEQEEESDDEDDDDAVSDKKKGGSVVFERSQAIRRTDPTAVAPKRTEVSDVESDEDEESDDEETENERRQLLKELKNTASTLENKKDLDTDDRQPKLTTTPQSSRKISGAKTDFIPSSSPRSKRTTIRTPSPSSHKGPPSEKRTAAVPTTRKDDDQSEEDSYFEEDEDEEEERDDDDDDVESRGLRRTGVLEGQVSDRDYYEKEEEEDDESGLVNAHVQELRTSKYLPGTQFIVLHGLNAQASGDLTIHKDEMLTLVEQRSDDWWLLRNDQTGQEGFVPINYIQLIQRQEIRRRVKSGTSAATLVDAFKTTHDIPDGFIASDLAPLTQIEEHQLWRSLIPKMTESNLAFVDLHWRADIDKLHVRTVTYQKIFTIKECVKIPRVKGEQIRVLDRCIRLCLHDGLEIVSNIHTIRAHIPSKINERDLTEDWHFEHDSVDALIDEQPQLLIRSHGPDHDRSFRLLIELSMWCQSIATQEKCEIGCGWSMIPLNDEKPPLITDTKSYNEPLNGGHIDEKNVLLNPEYKLLRSDGVSGAINRYKRARIKFSIESRESDIDLLYDNLPIQSLIVPLNLIKPIVFFRHELAFQLHKRHHPTGLSTTPIVSIFLSTFFDAISQPDLIFTLNRLYRSRKKRNLTSSSSSSQQRELFIKTYEIFIYPLLHYRQLPLYDFHDQMARDERRKLIKDMINRQLPLKRDVPDDILSILLDPNLTEGWTPFTTNEICFTLQKYADDFPSDIVA